MKKLSFSMLAMAGLLLVGCADKDVIAEGGGGQQGEVLSDGYMALNINLPTTPSTRADNDVYDDGTPNEYRVNDCALFLFAGQESNIEAAKLISVQDINLPFVGDSKDSPVDNITTIYQAVAKVQNYNKDKDGDLFALVFLNYKNVLTDGLKKIGNTPLQVDVDEEGITATTFGDIQGLTIAATNIAGNTAEKLTSQTGLTNRYFFMTNAVLSTNEGGSVSNSPIVNGDAGVFQLAKLNEENICPTREEAIDKPAGNILVERAVAKATLRYSEGAADGMSKDDNNIEITIKEVKWVIDNTETSSYIVRNIGKGKAGIEYPAYLGYSSDYFTSPNYRFVGNISVNTSLNNNGSTSTPIPGHDHGLTKAYRTYWCVDPHYNEDADLKQLETTEIENALISADGSPLYCYENTFNVKHQTYKNTTRAILKVTIEATKGGKKITDGLYSVNNDGLLYTFDGVKGCMIQKIFQNVNFLAMVDENLKPELKEQEGGYTLTEAVFNNCFEITIEETDGVSQLTKIAFKTDADKTANYPFETENFDFDKKLEDGVTTILEDIKVLVNENVVAREYKDGVMYYEARFRHFAGNDPIRDVAADGTVSYRIDEGDLAPWNCWEYKYGDVTNPSSDEAYPNYGTNSAERNYLGRYGMVRNNWYDVEIEKFKRPGLPTVPSHTFIDGDDETTDDHIDDYISVRIHVLSWAKRMQSWGF